MEDLPVLIDGLNAELTKKAEDELGETPEVRENALLELRKLINEKPDFYCFEDNKFLLRFLRSKKYKVQESFKTLQNYFALRLEYPNVVTDKIRSILEMGNIMVPPVRNRNGDIVIITNSGRFDLDKYSPEEIYSAATICVETLIDSEANQICRGHFILDLKEITLKKIKRYTTPTFISALLKTMENCLPFRLGSIHVMNTPFYFHLPYRMVYPLISEKHRKRINIHGGNYSELHKLFPPHMLPETLGGTMSKQTYLDFKNTLVNKHIEIDRKKKYNIHRQTKPVKKHSTCRLEESQSFLQNNTSVGFHQSEVTN